MAEEASPGWRCWRWRAPPWSGLAPRPEQRPRFRPRSRSRRRWSWTRTTPSGSPPSCTARRRTALCTRAVPGGQERSAVSGTRQRTVVRRSGWWVSVPRNPARWPPSACRRPRSWEARIRQVAAIPTSVSTTTARTTSPISGPWPAIAWPPRSTTARPRCRTPTDATHRRSPRRAVRTAPTGNGSPCSIRS